MIDTYRTHMARSHAAFMETQRENTFRDDQADPLRAAVVEFLRSYASRDVASDNVASYLIDLAAHLQDTECVTPRFQDEPETPPAKALEQG